MAPSPFCVFVLIVLVKHAELSITVSIQSPQCQRPTVCSFSMWLPISTPILLPHRHLSAVMLLIYVPVIIVIYTCIYVPKIIQYTDIYVDKFNYALEIYNI